MSTFYDDDNDLFYDDDEEGEPIPPLTREKIERVAAIVSRYGTLGAAIAAGAFAPPPSEE
ncbi:hypothetical protein RBS60_13040 [Sinomonas sp. ASV486]|uniref:hypothetical protein n=1 Tax=Sinomonas sp. ASV486 TaxID=3051170 RepID=UPI0027DDB236|nr:hypothetical protein [Sinomonas sp. ASV486]MDQ4491122.1 hypothetical protein [Sinomonas sp. ASV486]